MSDISPRSDALPLKVLCVEDDLLALKTMEKYLTRQGLTVITAQNGEQGLERFKQHQPQVVVSDIRMPVMDGITMCKTIHDLDPDVFLIMASAHNEAEMLMESINYGAVKYILKPVDPNVLMETINTAADVLSKRAALEKKLKSMEQKIDYVEYEGEKLQSYVSRVMKIDQMHDLPYARHLYLPMGTVSGDFFCVERHQNTVYALVADGTGHGPSAILPALQIPRVFRSQVAKGYSLLTIADALNRTMRENQLTGHFIATTLVRMSFEEKFIEVVNCGNPNAILISQTGEVLQQFTSSAMALGMMQSDAFDADVQRFECDQPAQLYVFTDGVPDTLNHRHQESFDLAARLRQIESTQCFDQLSEQLKSITEHEKFDDITLLELKFHSDSALRAGRKEMPKIIGSRNDKQASADDERLKTMKVLFVEDDKETREYMSRYLQRRVGALYAADNGAEGLSLFKVHKPDLVISDIRLPEISGVKMSEEIRRLNAEVPIILISGSMEAEQVESMLELNVAKLLMKPVDMERLRHAIVESVRRFDNAFDVKLSASVFMNTPLAITITSKDRQIMAVNPAFCQITGYAEDEVIGRNPRILSSGKHDAAFYQAMWKSINETGTWSGEIWNRRKDGELFAEWITINAVKDAQGELTHYVSIFTDVTERSAALAKARYLAEHDNLTNLPNRVLFMDRLSQALRVAQREKTQCAIIFLDVDLFKTINDTLGNTAGDELLVSLAQTLTACVRDTDTVSRLGGDEFAILLSNIESREAVDRLASKIIDAVNVPRQIAGMELQVGISMGICLYPSDGDRAEILAMHAESALYASKAGGRNHYRFFEAQPEDHEQRLLAIQQGMRFGLAHGEFSLVYQPKYSISQRRAVGAEALIRWHSPSLGAVSPVEFIPIAEETGFIVNISDWVIDTVFQQMATWKQQGVPLVPVAINISPRHFQRGKLLPALLQALEKYQLEASLFQIELTEGIVMNDSEGTMSSLLELRKHGFKVSIDDFGTGYSSLSYLRRLPIDELKIDRAFIKEISDTLSESEWRSVTAIPLSIIQLAKNLNFAVVAEGVETLTQQNFLEQNGCDVTQGYYFSKPLEADAFVRLLNAPR